MFIRNSFIKLLVPTLCLSSLVVGEMVSAQTIPIGAETGAIAQPRNYKDQTILPAKPKGVIKDQESKAEESEDVKVKKVQAFELKEVIVLDNTLIPQYELDHVINKYKNRSISFGQLQDLTQDLTLLYQKKGFVTSKFFLPPQKIVDGKVTIQASEGLIKPITLNEGSYFKQRSIFPRLQLDQYDHLNLEKIKNDLARINENPDIGLQAVLKPGKNFGETDLVLQTNDRFPIHLSPTMDNLGRTAIGNNRYGFGLTHNNLFGFGDRNTTSLNWSRSSFGVGNNYEIPVGKYGTKLGFNFSRSDLTLGGELRPLRIEGKSTTYSPYLSQELFRGKHILASADLALDFKNLSTDILDRAFHVDRLRVLRPGFNIDEFDKYGRTFFRSELGVGLGALGASARNSGLTSRLGSKPDFFRYTGNLTRITQLPFGIQDVLRISGQYSPHLLNSIEQMQVGGAFSVRGYKEGQFIGDSGYLISNEVRIPFYVFPKSWKFPMTVNGVPAILTRKGKKQPTYDYVLRDNIQLVGFTDFGGTFTNGYDKLGIRDTSDTAIGAGAGVRVRLTRFLTGRMDIGFPLVNDFPRNRQNHVVHFGLQSEMF